MLENLKEIKSAVTIIQDGLFTIASGLQGANATQVQAEIVGLNMNKNPLSKDPSNAVNNDEQPENDPDHIEVVTIETINENDLSTTSIDELVPELPTSGPNLNSFVQTIQQK